MYLKKKKRKEKKKKRKKAQTTLRNKINALCEKGGEEDREGEGEKREGRRGRGVETF
jgi:hypothetical protein